MGQSPSASTNGAEPQPIDAPTLLLSEDVTSVTTVPTVTETSIVPSYQHTTPWLSFLQAVPHACFATGDALYYTFTHIKHFFVTPEYDKTNVADAIEKLQSTLAFLDNKISLMNQNVVKYTIETKRLYAFKNKQAAIHQLRLKKMYEREVSKMDSLKFNIESNILHMESVGVMMETVSTIKETSHQFQIVSRHVDIDKLEDSIEEMFEQRDTSKDIENILNDMHNAHEFDEDELLEELETLISDESTPRNSLHQKRTHTPLILTDLPDAPNTAIHIDTDADTHTHPETESTHLTTSHTTPVVEVAL